MQTVLIVIHLMVVVALIAVVLLQRSEGGALGMGGGGGGGGSGLMSARGAADALTRTTAILATIFFATSLALGIWARFDSRPTDILDRIEQSDTGSGASVLDQLGGGDTSGGTPADEDTQVPTGQ